jgi:YVTN family beta-propeller protein
VVDGAGDSVLATVAAGRAPWALCYDAAYNKVYCASNFPDSLVTVIDGATDRVVATIRVGVGPSAFAWNPVQNRVYVACLDGSCISVLRDSGGVVGMEESFRPQTASPKPLLTIVRGVMMMEDRGRKTEDRSTLIDVSGRKVMDLHAGANDVRALAPGVYFVRQASSVMRDASSVTKVVIAR